MPHLDFTKAYVLSQLTGDDLKCFLRNWKYFDGKFSKNMKSMTKRDLKIAVRNFLKSRGRKTSSVQVPQQTVTNTSAANKLCDRFDRIESELSELAELVESDSGVHDTLAANLCELCQKIIQQLSPEDLESA